MTDIYTVFYALLYNTRIILASFVFYLTILCFIKRRNSFMYRTETLLSTFCIMIIIISVILTHLCGIIGIADDFTTGLYIIAGSLILYSNSLRYKNQLKQEIELE